MIIFSPAAIASRYMKSAAFVLDLLACFPDELFLIGSGHLRLGVAADPFGGGAAPARDASLLYLSTAYGPFEGCARGDHALRAARASARVTGARVTAARAPQVL